MRAVARTKMTRTSSQKINLVAALIRGKDAEAAQIILANTNKAAASIVATVLAAAIANAENNLNLKKVDLIVESVLVGAGPTLKRTRPRSRGQLNRIMKRTSHITIILSDQKDKAAAKPASTEAKTDDIKVGAEAKTADVKATAAKKPAARAKKEEKK